MKFKKTNGQFYISEDDFAKFIAGHKKYSGRLELHEDDNGAYEIDADAERKRYEAALESERAFFKAWLERFGSKPVTLKMMTTVAKEENSELRKALRELSRVNSIKSIKSLSWFIRRRDGRRYGEIRIVKICSNEWAVMQDGAQVQWRLDESEIPF